MDNSPGNSPISIPTNSNKGKRKPTHSQKKNEKRNRSEIAVFWNQHYEMEPEGNDILAHEVFLLYQIIYGDQALSYEDFQRLSNQVPALNSSIRKGDKQKIYKVTAISMQSSTHHSKLQQSSNITVENPREITCHNHILPSKDTNRDKLLTTFLTISPGKEKRKLSPTLRKAGIIKQSQLKKIMETHYDLYTDHSEILLLEVYQFYQTTKDYSGETLQEFTHMTNRIPNLRHIQKNYTKQKIFKVVPRSFLCDTYHRQFLTSMPSEPSLNCATHS